METKYLKIAAAARMGIDEQPNFSATGSIYGMKKQFYGFSA